MTETSVRPNGERNALEKSRDELWRQGHLACASPAAGNAAREDTRPPVNVAIVALVHRNNFLAMVNYTDAPRLLTVL